MVKSCSSGGGRGCVGGYGGRKEGGFLDDGVDGVQVVVAGATVGGCCRSCPPMVVVSEGKHVEVMARREGTESRKSFSDLCAMYLKALAKLKLDALRRHACI